MAPIEYDRRDFDKGPATYTDRGLLDSIHCATGLSARSDIAFVVDLMSGPGKVALGMQERSSQHRYAVLDNNQGVLDKITQPVQKMLADIRNLSAAVVDGTVDVATVRYGLKDIPKDQQPKVLAGINEMLKSGGVLVVADMFSSVGAKEFNNRQHSLKQQFNGRNIVREGECHIPTEAEWIEMLTQAGFGAEIFDHYISRVTTSDWVKGKQITDEQRAQMDALILSAPEDVKREFNIRQEENDVRIDFPVVIIKAVKPETKLGLPASGDVYVTK